ncbi:NAD(P)/FAD-dependent oxidoreductase [Acidianus brierleyi]|uniref:FAD-binding oxidoreductase n=1 Tax=Acidianus brierleyi TaxID=41673 RepID=A0A2U9IBQ9_9CREN|nr:FAD-dependent oxidoreductase [Acidianus brierleyi]AWR93451.1 FAD-dependent oxidoreductase [Acidianus brierleyi]
MYDFAIIGGGITGLLAAYYIGGNTIVIDDNSGNSRASLWSIIPPLCGKFYNQCIDAEKYYSELCDNFHVYCKRTHIIRYSDNKIGGKEIDKTELSRIEPNLNLDNAEYYDNGFFVEGNELIDKLSEKVKLYITRVKELRISNNNVKSILTTNGEISAKNIILTTGYKTKSLLSNININLYKGHLLILNKVGLNGILIYKDRIAVEGNNLYINGDSNNDTTKNINYDEVNKSVQKIGEVLPIDTHKFSIKVGFRTISDNGDPIIKKIFDNTVLVTGYKFGFALAPILISQVKDLL